MSNERSSKPFKKIDCTRREFLRMPGNALKIWMYYYTREGKERLAWASEEELCEATDLNRDTMRKWRNWLIENGWFKLMGHRDAKTGEFAVGIYRVKEGTVPESFGDGRSRNIPLRCSRNIQSPPQPKLSVTAAAEVFGEEVEPVKQVDSQKQLEPFEVASKKESNQSTASRPAGAAAGCLTANSQTAAVVEPEESVSEEKTTPTPEEYRGAESTPETDEVLAIWSEATGLRFKYTLDGSVDETRDVLSLIDQHGLAEVKEVLHITLNERPKSASMGWTDFNIFARNFEMNRRLARGFRRGKKAKLGGRLPSLRSHAELSRDANSESWIKDEIKWCEQCKDMHKVGGFCVELPEPELKTVRKGFDVEEA
jgi:hypothetical protein